MAIDYRNEIEAVKEHYADLLIMQYHSKYKARETVKLGAEIYMGNSLIFEIQDILDIDVAEGIQLDYIGKILDCPRTIPDEPKDVKFFSFHKENALGFSTIGKLSQGFFKDITYNYSSTYYLSDADYRTLLKFKAIANRVRASWKEIDDIYFSVWGTDNKIFNKNVFTVAGTPTITDDGIASGLISTSNYIKLKDTININANSDFRVDFQFNVGDNPIYNWIFRADTATDFCVWLGTKNLSCHIAGQEIINLHNGFQPNNSYKGYFERKGREYTVYCKNMSTHEVKTTTVTVDSDYTYSGLLRIGGNNSDRVWSTDLKQFAISVNDKVIYRGFKYECGIEVINNKNLSITYNIRKSILTDGLKGAIRLNYLEPPLGIGYNINYIED